MTFRDFTSESGISREYRYPMRRIAIEVAAAVILGVLFILVPILCDHTQNLHWIGGAIVSALVPIFFCGYLAYSDNRLRVVVDSFGLRVTRAKQQQALYGEVQSISCVASGRGSDALLVLKNGERVSAPGDLDEFKELMQTIRTRTGIPKKGWERM